MVSNDRKIKMQEKCLFSDPSKFLVLLRIPYFILLSFLKVRLGFVWFCISDSSFCFVANSEKLCMGQKYKYLCHYSVRVSACMPVTFILTTAVMFWSWICSQICILCLYYHLLFLTSHILMHLPDGLIMCPVVDCPVFQFLFVSAASFASVVWFLSFIFSFISI